MKRRYDHIDLRVPDLAAAGPFYQALLPALGFTRNDSNERWLEFEAEEDGIVDFFAITESAAHLPNETRIAFWAESPAQVDRLAALIIHHGGRNVEGPAFEYPHYYAVFFEDPCGNRFEICHRTRN